jgi:hypothetical protein
MPLLSLIVLAMEYGNDEAIAEMWDHKIKRRRIN